ncbi:MAG: CoA pyrophosphatase [Thermoleophilaceae bacterium]|nr:CoA pyrophosphatase [Thermoleophilaceae bacterium]
MAILELVKNALLPVGDMLDLSASGSDAAVLVAIRELDGEADLRLVFTRRPDHMRRHAGEVSFPGGKPEPGDDDLVHTALREAHEELGIDPSDVEVLGGLPPISTFVTNYAVYPVVGRIAADLPLKPHAGEVAAVLEYGLRDLVDVQQKKRYGRGPLTFESDVFDLDGNIIWGATARILATLIDRIGPDLAPPEG